MQTPSAEACRRQKTAIAYETRNIQGMAERFIAESGNYAIRRIPQGTYDTEQGCSPRKVRYSTAPIPDYEYIDPTVCNDGNEDQTIRGEDGQPSTSQSSGINTRGAMGCNIPGQTIEGGHDEFGRILRAKAWETDAFCAFDLLLKGQEHVEAFISMLRDDLPARAREQFEYQLERLVIGTGFYNTSCTAGFSYAQGAFPAPPAGTLDVGHLKRIMPMLKTEGWTGPFEVQVSERAFQDMVLNYKKNNGTEMNTVLDISDRASHYLGDDRKVVEFAGIRFVIEDLPPRGYLKQGVGGWEFTRVYPTKGRDGTGAGKVSEVNQDYFECSTYVDGKKYELYEVGLYIHPTACNRQAFAMPSYQGKRWSRNLFNFEVNMIDGSYIECNVDNFKFFFRILHAFGFESLWPERMGGIIYRVSPEQIFVNTPTCDSEPDVAPSPIDMAPALPVPHSECSAKENEPCSPSVADFGHIVPAPTQADPSPPNTAGALEFVDQADIETNQNVGTMDVVVRRVDGTSGAASVDLTFANGTALKGTHWDSPGAVASPITLNWADGEAGTKRVSFTIIDVDDGTDRAFTAGLTGASGAAVQGTTSRTVNIRGDS